MDTEKAATTIEVIGRFNEAFNRHDVDSVIPLMTGDVVFENTGPASEGSQHTGQDEVRRFWTQFFSGSPRAHFEVEDQFASDERCVVAWRYTWDPDDKSGNGYVRGVDLFRVRDGKVAEKLSYVKG